LAVLWLSAALAAIGFSLSITVRGETERTATALDGLRSYYLAASGIEKAAMELLWSSQGHEMIPKGSTFVNYDFPSGPVHVEIIPETAKLDLNKAPVEELVQLLAALGVGPGRADEIAAAIDDWRRPGGNGRGFDAFYQAQIPSFQSPHASFEEIEELLLVKGVTPDLFYGTYVPATGGMALGFPGEPAGRLVRRSGLVDCVTVYGSGGRVDANTADPAVLAAIGMNPAAIQSIVAQRQVAPFDNGNLGGALQAAGAGGDRLRVEGNTMVTFRATARLRLANGQLSDLRRTVGAQVKYVSQGAKETVGFPGGGFYHILRWYDTTWSN